MKPLHETTSTGRRQSLGAQDDDALVSLQIPRKWREKLRKIASLEERNIIELTEEAIRRLVTQWEERVGMELPDKPLSAAKGVDPESAGLPPPEGHRED